MTLHSGSLGSDHRVRFRHLTTSSEIIAASCPRYAVASSVKAPPGCSVWSFLGGLEQKVRLLRTSMDGVVKQLPLRLRRGQLHGRLAVDRPHPSRACHPGHFPLTPAPVHARFLRVRFGEHRCPTVCARSLGWSWSVARALLRSRSGSIHGIAPLTPHTLRPHRIYLNPPHPAHATPPRTLHPYSTPPHPAALLRLTLLVSIR